MSENKKEMSEGPDDQDYYDEQGTTESNYRWKGLSTVLALFIGIGFPTITALHTFGMVNMATVPQYAWLPISSGWLGVLVYTFGKDIRKAWNNEPNITPTKSDRRNKSK